MVRVSQSKGNDAELAMDDSSENPNLNTGTPWSPWDDEDIRYGLDRNRLIEETAKFLCRSPSEIRQRIAEIAEADAIGDPLLLRDRMIHRDRIALETYRDARAAMALIREAIEDCAPPGSVAREGYFEPGFHGRGGSAGARHLRDCRTIAPVMAWYGKYTGPPMTLGSAAAANLRLLVWC